MFNIVGGDDENIKKRSVVKVVCLKVTVNKMKEEEEECLSLVSFV